MVSHFEEDVWSRGDLNGWDKLYFRAEKSTETQLIQTIRDISKSLNNMETVDMAILYFTKARGANSTALAVDLPLFSWF